MARLTGLPFCDALEMARRRSVRNARDRATRAQTNTKPKAVIRARWGMEWHELLAMLHAQGLSKAQCAKAMGYKTLTGLNTLVWRHPEHNPWGSDIKRTIPAQYLIDTGETFAVAVRRMMAEGKTKSEAMTVIGYTRKSNVAFDRAMREYGIEDRFVHAFDPSRPRTPRWARILELRAGAPHKIRLRRPKAVSEGRPHPWLAIIKREARAYLERNGKN